MLSKIPKSSWTIISKSPLEYLDGKLDELVVSRDIVYDLDHEQNENVPIPRGNHRDSFYLQGLA